MYMKCVICGKEMKNIMGGNYVCDSCGLAINDLVCRGCQTATSNNIPDASISINHATRVSAGDIKPIIGDYPVSGFYQQGWVCPKCGAVLSPSTIFCPFCTHGSNKSTATSDRIPYDIDYTHRDSTTAAGSGQYGSPTVNKSISNK